MAEVADCPAVGIGILVALYVLVISIHVEQPRAEAITLRECGRPDPAGNK
jgi:hypothetical protein